MPPLNNFLNVYTNRIAVSAESCLVTTGAIITIFGTVRRFDTDLQYMRTTEQIKETRKLRNQRYYNSHKTSVNAKNSANYHAKKSESDAQLLQAISDRYRVQIDQAKTYKQNIAIDIRTHPYKQCIFCNHYSYNTVQTFITPQSIMDVQSRCGWCNKVAHNPKYQFNTF